MTQLEEQVLELIEKVYCCKYTRELLVTVNNGLYTLKLFLHDPNFGAVVISNQCASDEEFLEFIKKELNDRKLTRSRQFKLILYGNYES